MKAIYSFEFSTHTCLLSDVRILSEGSDGQAGKDEDGLGWLEEIEMPKEAGMVGVEYFGPQIIDWWMKLGYDFGYSL